MTVYRVYLAFAMLSLCKVQSFACTDTVVAPLTDVGSDTKRATFANAEACDGEGNLSSTLSNVWVQLTRNTDGTNFEMNFDIYNGSGTANNGAAAWPLNSRGEQLLTLALLDANQKKQGQGALIGLDIFQNYCVYGRAVNFHKDVVISAQFFDSSQFVELFIRRVQGPQHAC
jgi:hypothetical protein